jgi:hypothetical protein
MKQCSRKHFCRLQHCIYQLRVLEEKQTTLWGTMIDEGGTQTSANETEHVKAFDVKITLPLSSRSK